MIILYRSVIQCPACGFKATEKMPADHCVYYYRCEACATTIKPTPGDCCVFCSYGSVKCPPVQLSGSC